MSDGLAISASGTLGSAGGSVTLATTGRPVVAVEVSGPFVQSLIVEETINGANWVGAATFTAAGVSCPASVTTPARLLVNSQGRAAIRVRQTAYTTGTATVVLDAAGGSVGAGGGSAGPPAAGPVTIADGDFTAFGFEADAAAGTDTATATYMSLFKRLLQRVTALIGLFPTALTGGGSFKTAVAEALPAGTNKVGGVTVASGDDVTLGATTDGAVGDANGTLNAHLRQVAKLLGGTLTVVMGGGYVATVTADGADVVLGALADAAVTGDAPGTLSAKLRGLDKILTDVWDSAAHQLKVSGGGGGGAVTVADGADVVLGTLADAAVGDADGSINAHLRQVATSVAALIADIDAGVTVNGAVSITALPSQFDGQGSGTIAGLGDTVSAPVGPVGGGGYAALVLSVTGTFVGNITAVANLASGPLVGDYPFVSLDTGAVVSTLTAPGTYVADCAGLTSFLFTGGEWTSGTATLSADSGLGYRGAALGGVTDAAVGDADGTVNAHLRQVAKTLSEGVAVTPSPGISYTGVVDATHPTWDVTLAGLGSVTAQIYVTDPPDEGLQLWASNDGVQYQVISGYDDWLQYYQTSPDLSLGPVNAAALYGGGMLLVPSGWRYLRFTTFRAITAGAYAITLWESAAHAAVVAISGGQVNTTAYYGGEATLTHANNACNINCHGAATLLISVVGSFSGTIRARGYFGLVESADADPLPGSMVNMADGSLAAVISTPGLYQVDCAGFSTVNLVADGGWSGEATIVGACDSGLRAAVLGQPTDIAVTGDNAGTLSAKLRGLAQILGSVWDSFNNRLIVDASQVKVPVSTVDQLPYLVDKTRTGTLTTQGQGFSCFTDGCETLVLRVANSAFGGCIKCRVNVGGATDNSDDWPVVDLVTGEVRADIRADGVYAVDCAAFDLVQFLADTYAGGPLAWSGTADLLAGAGVGGRSAALGSVTDSAVVGSAQGTVSAKLRGLSEMLYDVWDAGNHSLRTAPGNLFTNVAANGTTTIKGSPGVLHTLTINKLGVADTVTLYDNTAGSGTVIATINSAVSQTSLLFDIAFSVGLTAVVAGTTAPDVTFSWR